MYQPVTSIEVIPKKKKKKNDGPSQQRSKSRYLYKRDYNEENIKAFNHRLLTIN